ncbi:glutamine amidotransferase, partial [Clostridium perfringens]
SYFHGSLLSKNPDLADRFLTLALSKKYGYITLEPINDDLELKAKEVIIKKVDNKK